MATYTGVETEPQVSDALAGRATPSPRAADVLEIVSRRWNLLLSASVAGAAISAVIAIVLPIQYRATALIMPPQQQQPAAMALLGQFNSMAAGAAGKELGIKNPSDLYAGLLRSRTIADNVIERFGLRALYGKATATETRKALSKRTTIDSGKDTLIQISVDDADPKRAADIANAYVEELQKQNSRLSVSESAQRRLFFEKQLESEKAALSRAEAEFKGMQQQTGMLQVGSQVELALRAIATLSAEIGAREAALQRLRLGATSGNPEVIRQEKELSAMREELARLERSRSKSGDAFVSPARAPAAGLEYVRRLRELKYHESLYEVVAKQYETARLDEAKESPVIQVVDRAIAPDQRSWPPRLLLTISGAVAAFFIGCGAAVFQHHRRAGRGVAA